MAGISQAIRKQSSTFLIELPEELKSELRNEKPQKLSLRRYIVFLLVNRYSTKLYNKNAR